MANYEIALVLNARVEEDVRAKTLDKVKEYITRFGGEIVNVDSWGKKRLAYEIQKMNDGYYYFIQLTSATDLPAEMERRLRILENVLRYLVVSMDEKEVLALNKRLEAKAAEAQKAEKIAPKTAPVEETPVVEEAPIVEEVSAE